MKPISPNILNHLTGGTCIQTSSTCVVWNGPNIPCINLCKGDTIDTVIYDLAQILCDITENVLDVTTLDFACLIGPGDCPPETLLETLQAIITKVCSLPTSSTPCPPPTGLPIINLPPCLYYTNVEGDNVTALPLDEYAQYLAGTICQIIADINSINSVITVINNRLTVLELNAGSGGGGSPVTTIVSQCYTGTAPGQTVALSTALTNLETKLCQYNNTLGTLTEWQNLISATCITGSTPLPCGTGTYSTLPGWVNPITSVADSLTNLWLVVCKLNECITGTTPTPACALLPPTNVTVTEITTTTCKINWVAPVITTGLASPVGYKIEVFTTGGVSVSTNTVGPTPLQYSYTNPSIVAGTQYVVKVSAIYVCGTSDSAQITSELKAVYYAAKLYLIDSLVSSVPLNCTPGLGTPEAYIEENRKVRIELKNPSTSAPYNNSAGQPIEVVIGIETIGCGGSSTITNHTISIPVGTWFAEYNYVAAEKQYCSGPNCTTIVRTVNCFGGAALADTSPLPAVIGIDTSITSLGNC